MSMNKDEQSILSFGAIDDSKYSGEIKYYPVKDQLFWSIQLDDVLVDGKSTGYCQKKGVNCLITPDSGTSAITFPSAAFSDFDYTYGGDISCTD